MPLLPPAFMDLQSRVAILGTRKMQPGDVLEPLEHRGGHPCRHIGTAKSSFWAQVSHAMYLRATDWDWIWLHFYFSLYKTSNICVSCMWCSSIIGASYGIYIWRDLSITTRKLNIWDSLYILRRLWIIYRVKKFHSWSNHKAVFKIWNSSVLEKSVYPHAPFLSIKISAKMLLLLWGLGSPSTRSRLCFAFCWMYTQGDVMAISGLWQ